MIFSDRHNAGEKLAEKLLDFKNRTDIIILALPRGGVPVAYEVAKSLKAQLDVFLVRKVGVPGHKELAMGAIAMGGIKFLNKDVMKKLNISNDELNNAIAAEEKELMRREKKFRMGKPELEVKGKIAILIDDGLATGASMKAAISALRLLNPYKIIVAVPASSRETCDEIEKEVDDIICAFTPEMFLGVGQWYKSFSQTTDEEVIKLLKEAEVFTDAGE